MKDQLIITNVIIIVGQYGPLTIWEQLLMLLPAKLDLGAPVVYRVAILVLCHNQFLVTR